jgi:hypothetical protein
LVIAQEIARRKCLVWNFVTLQLPKKEFLRFGGLRGPIDLLGTRRNFGSAPATEDKVVPSDVMAPTFKHLFILFQHSSQGELALIQLQQQQQVVIYITKTKEI